MQRRNAIKNIMVVSGSLVTLPWWMGCSTGDEPSVHQSSFSKREQELLASVADTIIPAGNAVGALKMEVDVFLQKILDDCYEKPVRDNIKIQLASLNEAAKSTKDRAFEKCTQDERAQLFREFSKADDQPKKDFFNIIRSETIRGFATSKEVMLNYNNYKIAPGHYHGCVAIKA